MRKATAMHSGSAPPQTFTVPSSTMRNGGEGVEVADSVLRFEQRLDLGWVLVGEVCLGNAHKPSVSTFKTNVMENVRPA